MAAAFALITRLCPKGTLRRHFISCCRVSLWGAVMALFRSLVASYRLTGAVLPVRCFVQPGARLTVSRRRGAHADIRGIILVQPYAGVCTPSSLVIGENGLFQCDGEFSVGPGVHISVSRNARLRFGGRRVSTGSGITANTWILCRQSITIGVDVIIAWGCSITDSDWHTIEGVDETTPVVIGDNVWVAHDVSITRGAMLPEGCVVGAKSLVTRKEFVPNSVIAGVPASVKKVGVSWHR